MCTCRVSYISILYLFRLLVHCICVRFSSQWHYFVFSVFGNRYLSDKPKSINIISPYVSLEPLLTFIHVYDLHKCPNIVSSNFQHIHTENWFDYLEMTPSNIVFIPLQGQKQLSNFILRTETRNEVDIIPCGSGKQLAQNLIIIQCDSENFSFIQGLVSPGPNFW